MNQAEVLTLEVMKIAVADRVAIPDQVAAAGPVVIPDQVVVADQEATPGQVAVVLPLEAEVAAFLQGVADHPVAVQDQDQVAAADHPVAAEEEETK